MFNFFKKQQPPIQPQQTPPPCNLPPVTYKRPPQVPVIMLDGSTEYYPEDFIIGDGKNCVVCMDGFYHTSLRCESLKWELNKFGGERKAMLISDAKKEKRTYCQKCSRDKYLVEHGRSDEVQ